MDKRYLLTPNLLSLLLLLLVFSETFPMDTISYDDERANCNIELQAQFNIQGLRYPIINERIQTDTENKFCGDIKYTCCSRDDLPVLREIWSNVRNKLQQYSQDLIESIQ